MIEAEVKYKNAGIDWMLVIPEHWEIRRLKNVCRFIYGNALKAQDRNENGNVDVFGSNGFVGKHDVAITEEPCIIIGRKGSFGKINLSENKCFPIDTTYYVDKTVTNENIYWVYYLLQCLRLDAFSKDSAVPGLAREDAYLKLVPVPTIDEQDEIVNHINIESDKITHFIETKQRFIELLKEQRQSIITNAVTKGIDDGVKMKETGIDWIGQVPEHWVVSRLKFIGESFIGLTYSPTEIVDKEKGILVLRASNIQNGRLSLQDNVYVRKEVPEKLKTKNGDILLCSRNGSAELIGKNIFIDDHSKGQTFGAFMTIFRSPLNNYLYYFFNSNIFLSQTFLFGTSTVNQLTNYILSNLVVAFPTNYSEQLQIIEHIKTETKTIDIAISKAEREIELIKEYREAMIVEAVTGKIIVNLNH